MLWNLSAIKQLGALLEDKDRKHEYMVPYKDNAAVSVSSSDLETRVCWYSFDMLYYGLE